MKIQAIPFQHAFLKKAAEVLPKSESATFTAPPVDQAVLSSEVSGSGRLEQRFSQAVLAVATSAQLAGIPTLAAIAQEVGQSLITPEQEKAHGESIAKQYSDRVKETPEQLEAEWDALSSTVKSEFGPPVVIDTGIVFAQADTTGMYIGQDALRGELSNKDALAFTLAHEEAHRTHRDSAGAKGLETLYELVKDEEKLFPLAFKALVAGRHQNEYEADLFAVQTLKKMGRDVEPAFEFLNSLEEDLQHPAGPERVAYVRANLS